MRKYLGIILAMTLILSLAACGGKDTEPDEQQPIPTGIENEETAFHKALVPVKYREEEEVQSTYYKTVFENDEAYYEVQPDGEDALRIPISNTVIYGVEDGDNYVEKVTLSLDDGQTVEQYQLYVQLDSGFIHVTGEKTPADAANEDTASGENPEAADGVIIIGTPDGAAVPEKAPRGDVEINIEKN